MTLTRKQSKTLTISAIICLALSLLFVCVIIGLSISKNYAENHYEISTTKEIVPTSGIASLAFPEEYHTTIGCGDISCKYCNGKTINLYDFHKFQEYSISHCKEFVFYRTINGFQTALIVLACLSFASGGALLAFRFFAKKEI